MTLGREIPLERSQTTRGRDLRCAVWMSKLLESTRGTFTMTARAAPCDQVLRLVSSRGGLLCSVPRAVFRAWTRRGWIEAQGWSKHGQEWAVTDLAREAAASPLR